MHPVESDADATADRNSNAATDTIADANAFIKRAARDYRHSGGDASGHANVHAESDDSANSGPNRNTDADHYDIPNDYYHRRANRYPNRMP